MCALRAQTLLTWAELDRPFDLEIQIRGQMQSGSETGFGVMYGQEMDRELFLNAHRFSFAKSTLVFSFRCLWAAVCELLSMQPDLPSFRPIERAFLIEAGRRESMIWMEKSQKRTLQKARSTREQKVSARDLQTS